jgi:hypothetical protein
MRSFKAFVAVGFAAAVAVPAARPWAQGGVPDSSVEAQAPDEVIVRGRRMSEIEDDLRIIVDEFVGEVVAPSLGRGLARWNKRLCVGVSNVNRSAGQYIADRISRLAADVGLDVGEPGCVPDVVVLFTTDGPATAAQMVDTDPTLFRPAANQGGSTRGRAALDDFVRSDRAVRWWHVSLPVDARNHQPAIWMPQMERAPSVNVAGPSRIHDGVVDDLVRVLIVVDSRRLAGATWQQLGDYLAVISLAQIDPDANTRAFDTILNLFSNPKAYSGLTDWDLSYVRALYEYDQERVPSLHVSLVASEMVDAELERGQ